tara:strand:- start:499 stop:972 length:474 start_codon:yes stop_codon:yes gene_type:complete
MKTSQSGLDHIKSYEGCKLKTYRCSGKVLTIGWGHTKGVEEDQEITQKEADAFLVKDIEMVETHVDRLVKTDLEQHQWDAIVSWCFNLGCGNLRASTMLQVINSGDLDKVSEQIIRWDKVGKKAVAGLTRRRKAEADLFDNGKYEQKADKPKAKSNG